MPTPTYDLLDSVTLSTTATSVTFSSISQDYGDLVLVYEGSGSTFSFLGIRFNDSASNYAIVNAYGNGSSVASEYDTSISFGSVHRGPSARYPATATVQVFDYRSTSKHKTYLSRFGNITYNTVEMLSGKWGDTNPVTSLTVLVNSGNFLTGSVFNLYGIAK